MQTPFAPSVFIAALAEAKGAHLAGDFARARRMYESLLASDPGEPGPEVLLAELDMRDGRFMTAKRRLERVAAKHPKSLEVRAALANVLEELGDVTATTIFYREETDRQPDSRDGWVRLAAALQRSGRIEEAANIFGYIVNRWPDDVAGYFGLVGIDATLLSDGQIDRLRAIATGQGAPIDERVHAYFALGNVCEIRKQYDSAFVAFAEGNRLRRENPNLHPDPPEWMESLPNGPPVFTSVEQAERMHDNFVNETMRNFTSDYLAKFAGRGDPSPDPIFIVGMPRSGSTLLEQILSSHPDVQGLGETQALSRTFRAALAEVQHDPSAPNLATFYRRMGGAYLDALRELGWDGKRRVIDKMLGNYINIGVIHLALPNAIILHSMRDPVDTCLSCFRQLFGRKNETSYDLGAIGRQYVRYRKIMAHWDGVLPGRVRQVVHEELIADPEQEIRRLVMLCGLSWAEACLSFDRTERVVKTASASQVRRPIYRSATKLWRSYEKHLGALFEALDVYAPAK